MRSVFWYLDNKHLLLLDKKLFVPSSGFLFELDLKNMISLQMMFLSPPQPLQRPFKTSYKQKKELVQFSSFLKSKQIQVQVILVIRCSYISHI